MQTELTGQHVALAFIAVLHLVTKKLKLCPSPSSTHAKNVHSSDLSQVSYLT
jgi:hypothetical protein